MRKQKLFSEHWSNGHLCKMKLKYEAKATPFNKAVLVATTIQMRKALLKWPEICSFHVFLFRLLCSLDLHNWWLKGTTVSPLTGGLGRIIFSKLGGKYSTGKSHLHDNTVSPRLFSNLFMILQWPLTALKFLNPYHDLQGPM